ncbi:MAG: hypothetical protein ACLQE9_04600 [Roseiarcus sp.]
MGDLLFFRPSPNAARPTRADAQTQEARILFFTGVRYGRQPEPVPARVDQDAPPKGGVDGTGGGRRKRRG